MNKRLADKTSMLSTIFIHEFLHIKYNTRNFKWRCILKQPLKTPNMSALFIYRKKLHLRANKEEIINYDTTATNAMIFCTRANLK